MSPKTAIQSLMATNIVHDIKEIKALNKKNFTQILDVVIEFCEQKLSKDKFTSRLQQVKDVENHSSSTAAKALLVLFRVFKDEDFTPDEVKSCLCEHLQMSEEYSKILVFKWENMTRNFHNKSEKLIDMEWKFGVTAGNSEVDHTGACFIQLKLILEGASGRKIEYLEMTLTKFFNFLHEMEKANINLNSIK